MKEDHVTNLPIQPLKWCVIIPTYNNAKTLERVLNGVLEYTSDVIVVNDGATDNTSKILDNYHQIERIYIPINKGKGNALKKGFELALSKGFDYAITIDSDGQHFPSDIPLFVEALEQAEDKKVLLIGARNMKQEGVPGGSSFGNSFSNFWFWAETGISLKDTQSGFRLYPIKAMENISLHTSKFEFEIEAIVKAAWKDIVVQNIPIQVLYDKEERVSHFRPYKDFARISILNTYLVIVALVYIFPRNAVRRFKKKGFKKFITEDLLGHQDSPKKKALSIALGVFIGLSPLWGFHTLLVISLSVLFRLNKAIAFAFSNVSLPPFIPFIIYLSLQVGAFLLGQEQPFQLSDIHIDFQIFNHLKTYILGSFTLAIVVASFFGILGYLLLSISSKKRTITAK